MPNVIEHKLQNVLLEDNQRTHDRTNMCMRTSSLDFPSMDVEGEDELRLEECE